MIKIIAIGRIKEKAQVSLIEEYMKRLRPVHKVEILELDKSKHSDNEVSKIIQDESQRILSKLKDTDYVILLDLKGENISSEKLASHLNQKLMQGKNVIFIIGGSHGVSSEIKNRADFMWQLSKLTFPHQLVRQLLVEQIYRAFMIIKQHPYHK